MATYEQILKANQSIGTTDIKGKDYAEVNQRVKAFRMVYPDGCITTEIISLESGVVVMKASAFDGEGTLIATGLAYEKESASFINKTSYIENCETSAVGRCMGFAGFGIETSICSAEELQNALNQQTEKKPNKPSKQVKAERVEEEKKKAETAEKQPSKASANNIRLSFETDIIQMCSDRKIDLTAVLAKKGKNDLSELTDAEINNLLQWVEKRPLV